MTVYAQLHVSQKARFVPADACRGCSRGTKERDKLSDCPTIAFVLGFRQVCEVTRNPLSSCRGVCIGSVVNRGLRTDRPELAPTEPSHAGLTLTESNNFRRLRTPFNLFAKFWVSQEHRERIQGSCFPIDTRTHPWGCSRERIHKQPCIHQGRQARDIRRRDRA